MAYLFHHRFDCFLDWLLHCRRDTQVPKGKGVIMPKKKKNTNPFYISIDLKDTYVSLTAQDIQRMLTSLDSSQSSPEWSQGQYIEPEVDEQGTLYGYKILEWINGMFFSPLRGNGWYDGELEADYVPNESRKISNYRHDGWFGIHCAKIPNHKELNEIIITVENSFLVKCALSGKVIEHEEGFRAQHAQIIGVNNHECWQTYQDFRECAETYSRRISKTTWESTRYFNPNPYSSNTP